ncbi:thermonuclease family protein [Thermoflavimicrobium daqui]|nr:thermonuclease family protein [Thermoflavimicrobium daqui]
MNNRIYKKGVQYTPLIFWLVLIISSVFMGCQDEFLVKRSVTEKFPEREQKSSAIVSKVIDGDTIEIDRKGKKEIVRLIMVDTPELNQNKNHPQPFAHEAKLSLKKFLEGQLVLLEKDEQERDPYGRMLFYVYKDDRLVQEWLVMQGYARVKAYPPNLKYYDRLKTVEENARRKQIKIWSQPSLRN